MTAPVWAVAVREVVRSVFWMVCIGAVLIVMHVLAALFSAALAWVLGL